MDAVRHFLAVLVLVVLPPGVLFWPIVHPFARWWRRVGPVGTYLFLAAAWITLSALLYQIRELLAGQDFGTNWAFVALSIPFFAGATALELRYWKYLSIPTLIGLPELSESAQHQGKLLREGIYGVVRHPRYLSAGLSLIGYALVSNYLGMYIFILSLIPIGYVTLALEERELIERFGDAYRQYQREVPQIIPRFWRTR